MPVDSYAYDTRRTYAYVLNSGHERGIVAGKHRMESAYDHFDKLRTGDENAENNDS